MKILKKIEIVCKGKRDDSISIDYFDEKGRKTKGIFKVNKPVKYSYEDEENIKYDDKDREIEVSFARNGKITHIVYYNYAKMPEMTEQIIKNSSGKTIEKAKTYFDENNRWFKDVRDKGNGKIISSNSIFDKNGNEKRVTRNGLGKITNIQEWREKDGKNLFIDIDYRYDKNNKLIEKKKKIMNRFTEKKDKEGNIIETILWDDKDKIEERMVDKYDGKNLIERCRFDSKDNLILKCIHKYFYY